MSDIINGFSRRSQPKGKKNKNLSNKTKQRKQKSRVTQEYERNEREVQELLRQTVLSIDSGHSADTLPDIETQSVQFFCVQHAELELDTEKPQKLLKHTKHTEYAKHVSENISSENDTEVEETDLENEDKNVKEKNIIRRDSSSSPQSTTASYTHGQQTTASTYLQIDVESVTQKATSTQYTYEDDLLYQPSALLYETQVENLMLNRKDLTSNLIRMWNRFEAEAKAKAQDSSHKISLAIWSELQQGRGGFILDTKLYRSFCLTQFRPIFCEPTPIPMELPTRKFIKLYIKELRFNQHPLLLEEHRLTNALDDVYERYKERLAAKLCEQLQAQLQTERKIVNELLRQAGEDQSPKELTTAKVLEQHTTEVRALRKQLYEEEATNKQLLCDILNQWKQLKELRSIQQFQCTRFQLRLQVRSGSNLLTARKNWLKRFETDLNEWYREELQLYYRAKRLWKQRDSVESKNHASPLISSRPKKPDIELLSIELESQLAACAFTPDEPHVDIWRAGINEAEFYTMPHFGELSGKLRSFFIRIYFDDEFVGATRSYRLEPDLHLVINETIGIFVERRPPQVIKIILYEKSNLGAPNKIATMELYLPTQFSENSLNKNQMEYLNFNSSKQPPISGRLTLRFQCKEEQCSNNLFAPSKAIKAAKSECKTWSSTQGLNNMKERFEKTKIVDETDLDEQSEENVKVLTTCTFEEQLLQFADREELENNRRFQLLHSRYLKHDARTRDLRCIPALEHELEHDWRAQEEPVIEPGNWMDPIDLHKHMGKKYLNNLYNAIRCQCVCLNKVMDNTENLLVGDVPATWSSFFQTLALLFQRRRPLNPIRTNGSKAMSTTNYNSSTLNWNNALQFKVILNVVRASGIPVRTTQSPDMPSKQTRGSVSGSGTFMAANLNYSNVRPFVSISYKDKFCRTMTAEGSNPTWNEHLALQLSDTLNDFRDDLKISLFDEVIENHINEEASTRNMDMYQRLQTNWLGEYRIPVSSILAMHKFDGVLELNVPKVLLGYKRPTLDALLGHTADSNITMEHYPEIKEAVRLWYYLSIEPFTKLEHVDISCLECAELKDVRQGLQDFKLQLLELKPQRFVEPLVCTGQAKRVCMTRLLEAVPLPIEASENLLDSVCRYVSLLRPARYYDPCLGFDGVWLDNKLLLDTTWSSAKDLGVLLCNYLLSIGMQCWLVLGIAIPYGEASFVLYHGEDGELLFIDPSLGRRYAVKDVFCPLNKVNCVISPDNIYYNIQTEARVSMSNFNLKDSSCWLPLFSKRNPAPLGGVQQLNYTYYASQSTAELRKNIERKIMKKISAWRTMRKTIWNRAFQTHLQGILQNLEHSSTYRSNLYDNSNNIDQLVNEFSDYKLYGFTLNFAYTNLSNISERIKATGIHLNTDNNVEFALAVHLHAYPNNVISVWIFLMSIVPV